MFKLMLIVALAVAVEAGYGYRGYGGYGYSRGYGYGGYGYGRSYGYSRYGYGKREAEADPALLYAGPYNYGYAGALTAYTGYPYAAYGAYPYAAYGAYPYAYGYFGGLQAHPNGAVTPVDEPA